MNNCDVNNKFNCSPYVKYIFLVFVMGLALMSCSQDVRVENDDFFSSAVLLVEDDYFSKVIDRNTSKVITNDMFESTPEKIQSKISNVYTYQGELYFLLKKENKIKVYKKDNFEFITEYDFNGIGQIEDVVFPNVSNFYVSLSDKDQVAVVDRVNKKISNFLISVKANPNKLFTIEKLVYVACENSIDIIRTGTKEVIESIALDGKPLLLSTNLDKNALIIFTKEESTYQMNIYNAATFQFTNKVKLESEFLTSADEMTLNQIAIVNNEKEYSWLGTSVGLFRIDLRNLGVYKFMSSRKENILNIYFEPISDKILMLSSRNQLKDYIHADSKTGEYTATFPLPDNSNLIYPL